MSQPFSAFGLDLSGTNARVALLHQTGKNFRVQTFAQTQEPIPPAKNGMVDPAVLGPWLAASLRGLGMHLPKHVALAIPDEQCFVFTVKIRKGETSDLAEAVRWEAGQHLPYELDELVFDWQVLTEKGGMVSIQVAAMQKQVAENYSQSVEQAGFTPVAIVPSSIAGINVFSEHIASDTPLVILLFQNNETVLSLLGNGGIAVSIPSALFTGEKIRTILRAKLQLSDAEVERTLQLCETDPIISKGILQDALGQELAALAQWVNDVAGSANQFSFSQPTQLLLTGEHSAIQSLDQVLHAQTNLAVTNPVPMSNLQLKKRGGEQQILLTEYCAALGAALHPIS